MFRRAGGIPKSVMTSYAHAQTAVAVLDEAHDATGVSVTSPGQISKAMAEELARKVPASLIADAILELINAKRMTKHGLETDVRAKEAGLKLALAYKVGLPIQRTEAINVNLDADSAVGMKERLAHSPALRAIFRKILDEVESES